jgi:hypothetical protein
MDENFYRIVYELDKSEDINKHWLFIGKKNGYFRNIKEFNEKFNNFKCNKTDKNAKLKIIKKFINNYSYKLEYQPYYDKIFFDYIKNMDLESVLKSHNFNLNSKIIYIDYDIDNPKFKNALNDIEDILLSINVIPSDSSKSITMYYEVKQILDEDNLSDCKYFINLKDNINQKHLKKFYENNTPVFSLGKPKSNLNNFIIYFNTSNELEEILKIYESGKTFDIIIPCYNTELYINNTIKSIFSQTYKNFSLYLINDNSSDNTLEILNEYKLHPKVTIVSNPENIGKYNSINMISKYLKSDYFLIVDSDDFLVKNRLVYDLMGFSKNNSCLINQTKYYRYNELDNRLILEPNFGENIVTFKNEIFDLVGKFFPTRFGGDTEYIERILKFYGESYINQIDKISYISIIRKDESNLTKSISISNRIKFVRKYKKLHELNNINFFLKLIK